MTSYTTVFCVQHENYGFINCSVTFTVCACMNLMYDTSTSPSSFPLVGCSGSMEMKIADFGIKSRFVENFGDSIFGQAVGSMFPWFSEFTG